MVLGVERGTTRRFTEAVAAPFVWLRIPPNAVTLFTIVPAVATAWLLYQHEYGWALLAGTVTAASDFVDGAVARAHDRTTAFGGFLDSLVDRYVDAIFLFGIGFALDTRMAWLVVGVGLVGTFGTSYARARAYQDRADVPPATWAQMLERPERIILLALGVAGQWAADAAGYAWDVLFWTLVVYALGVNLTVLVRAAKVHALLRENR